MATMRESLKKLAEVAKPVPGDEQDFVAKHGMKIMDFQGKDSISQESPYDHILKNVAVVKAPGQPGKDDHGHDAPGESEAAYHIPESRDAKLAKLSEMMGKEEDEEDEDEEEEADEEEDEDKEDKEEDKKKVDEAKKDVTGVKMHYHNPKTGEKFHEVHFSVPAAEKFRKQHEKAGFKLVKKEAQFSEEVEQVNELKDTTLKSYLEKRPAPKIGDVLRATYGKSPEEKEKVIDRVNNTRIARAGATSRLNRRKRFYSNYSPPAPREPDPIGSRFDEELLPKQKAIARDLLAKEMQKRKEERAAKKQAGTMKLKEEDRREANDKAREARVATPRPHTPKTVEGMRYRLQAVKKQIIDKT